MNREVRTIGPAKRGFAVSIRREDGSEFFACSGNGVLPAVFAQRVFAVSLKRQLWEHFPKRCRVVPVEYAQPILWKGNDGKANRP
jgi:hypothetical protein